MTDKFDEAAAKLDLRWNNDDKWLTIIAQALRDTATDEYYRGVDAGGGDEKAKRKSLIL